MYNKATTKLFLILLVFLSLLSFNAKSQCQVAYYPFTGNAIDSSGNGHNGTLYNDPTDVSDRFNNPSCAYHFENNQYMHYIEASDLELSQDLSFSAWINIDTLINDTNVISFVYDTIHDGTTILGSAIIKATNELIIAHDTSANNPEIIHTGYHIYPHLYYHIVITRDDTDKNYKLYINNNLINEYSYPTSFMSIPLGMQGITVNTGLPTMSVNGIIDDVIIYKCVIDSATVDSLFHIGGYADVCDDFVIDTLDVTDVVCGQINGVGDVVVSGGSGYYTYLWSNGDTTSNTLNLIAGMNSIIVKDTVFGCEIIQYFNVNNTNAPIITVSSSDNITCNGQNDGNIFTNVSGGGGNYTYNWSTGSHLPSINNLYAGTYSLTVIDDAGCIASETFTITEPDELVLSFNTTNSSCGNADGTAAAIIEGGTPTYSYLWSTSETTNTINSLSAGAYSVTVTDLYGCQVNGSAMVSDNGAPTITLDSITPASCGIEGQVYVTIGNATSPTYEWNGNTVTDTDNLTGQSFTQNTLTVNDGNCTAMQDFYIPYTLPEKQEICIVTVDSSTGANLIVWEKQLGLQNITGYRIYRETSIPDEYVYLGTTYYNDLGVYVDSMAYPWIRSYKYKIAVIDDCDMISELSEPHKTIHVNLNIGYLQNTVNLIWDNYEGFPYTSFNILRYDVGTGWNQVLGSPLPNNLHSITADVLGTTSMYAITVNKPGNACLASKTSGGPYSHSLSNLDDYSLGTFNNTISDNNNISLYPNPTNSVINIKADNIQEITITDISGQVIYRQKINSNFYSVDMNNNAKGVYFVKISGNNYSVVRKFILE